MVGDRRRKEVWKTVTSIVKGFKVRRCSQPQTEVIKGGPTAMHKQVKKLFCHAETRRDQKIFQV